MLIRMNKRQTELHQNALAEFDTIQSALRDERMQCLQDRRFATIAGAQWEGPLGLQFENKPKFEFNKVHLAVIRVINEYRNNRITVDFLPKDGSNDDELADACDGMYRADENACSADEAYDTAFEEGITGGMGAWRLRAKYEDEYDDDNDKQRLWMEPIPDADSCVFWNLGAKRYDKSDAKRCYVLTPFPIEEYKAEFGDNPASWPRQIQQSYFDWCSPDLVWVCEYYVIDEVKETVRFFAGLDDAAEPMRVTDRDIEADPRLLDELQATGFRQIREKKARRRRVTKYLLTGGGLLNEGEEIPGEEIPVVPFYGKRWIVDGVERCMGHVRLAKDAQRLMNSLLSWLAEIASRFDVSKPIFDPRQISNYAQMWADDNIKRYPYLLADMLVDEQSGNPIPGSQAPVAYTKSPEIPPAMAALVQFAEQALQDMLGNQGAGEEMQPNLSGKAVELIQTRLDMQTFIYMSNLAKSMKRSGEIWLSMMRGIAVEDSRRMKTVDDQGETSSVVLNRPVYDADEGRSMIENDMGKASYDVSVDVGPSSSSRRAATVRALTGMMQLTQDPETQTVLSSLAMMNMEGEGITDARDYFRRKLVRMGVVKPTKDEAAELAAEAANAQPDPNAQYLLAAAQKQEQDALLARAKAVNTDADTDLKQAQTVKTMAEAGAAVSDQQIAVAQAVMGVMSAAPGAMGGIPDGSDGSNDA